MNQPLIEPYGIEIKLFDFDGHWAVVPLIEPYGIEIIAYRGSCN